jgi:Sugar transferases involved in lipopolysaccharide synthesis
MYKYNKRNFIDFRQMFLDLICVIISYLLASFISNKEINVQNLLSNIWIPVLFSILYICFMYISEMYSLTTFTYQDRALRDIMLSSILSYIVCLFMLMFVQPENANKLFFTIFLLVVLFMLISQFILSHEIRKNMSNGKQNRVLMIGSRENIQEYIYYLKKTSFKFNIIGYITTDGLFEIPELTNLGGLQSVDTILNRYTVDEVIFAVHYSKIKEIENYIVMCENRGLIARVALDFFELNRVNSNIHCVGTIPVLSFQTRERNTFYKFVKRIFDVIVSLVGFVFLVISSIMLVPLILISSGGPAFEKGDFLTLNGRYFKLIRFRANQKNIIGKFMRSTGIAGLPQVINILKGEMSIVGTKPATPADVESFDKKDFRRVGIRPGVIGLWSLDTGYKSIESSDTIYADEKYMESWSPARDFIIILKAIVNKLKSK